jgi:hypothetical protein
MFGDLEIFIFLFWLSCRAQAALQSLRPAKKIKKYIFLFLFIFG